MVVADKQLLLIDNHEAERSHFASYLESIGYSVLLARDIEGGLALLQEHSPQLILCDLNVTVQQDEHVMETIKSKLAEIPVILMSSISKAGDVVYALRHGASDYLIKPIVDMQVVGLAIRRCLERDELRRENLLYRHQLEKANEGLLANIQILEQDQLAGREVQLKMLPNSPASFGRYHFSHRIVPSLYLSGDFVDYFTVGDHHVVFLIADVSGHGASSAFVTVLLKNMFARKRSDYTHRDDDTILSPLGMLDVANSNLRNTEIGKHATLCVGVINLQTDQLNYSVAGHLPLPVLTVSGKTHYLQGEGMPVGLFESVEYIEKTLQLPEDFVLTLFTDGILEVLPVEGVIEQESYLLDKLQPGYDRMEAIVDVLELDQIADAPDDIAVLLITKNSGNG